MRQFLPENPSLVRCPECGAIYGGFGTVKSCVQKCSLSSVEGVPLDDSRLIVKKELVSLVSEADDVRVTKVQSYEAAIARVPTFGVERILKDGVEVKLTPSRISTCLSNVPFGFMSRGGTTGMEIGFICGALHTESVPKGVLTITQYPVLDTIYQTYMIDQLCDKPGALQHWIGEALGRLVPGEKACGRHLDSLKG